MFIVIFCCLFILFLIVSSIISNFLLLLAKLCDLFFKNKFLRTSGYVFALIVCIGLIIFSVILAYELTPEILEYFSTKKE